MCSKKKKKTCFYINQMWAGLVEANQYECRLNRVQTKQNSTADDVFQIPWNEWVWPLLSVWTSETFDFLSLYPHDEHRAGHRTFAPPTNKRRKKRKKKHYHNKRKK